ncbi:MAG: conjugative transposon protein TraM [Bacteroidota bacterium]
MRFYLVLPMLVLPFITIAFWLMGGGANASNTVVKKSGLNTSLPDAHNGKDSGRDKMSFYEMANADSAKRNEQLRNDPNFKAQSVPLVTEEIEEHEILQPKVRAIRERIKIPEYRESVVSQVENYSPLASLQSPKVQVDPDLEAINQTIEKLSALQYPAKAADKIVPEAGKEVLSVNASTDDDVTYFGKQVTKVDGRQFLNENGANQKADFLFSAIIPTAQALQAGSVVRLQLSQSITLGHVIIPAGSMVYGVCSIENERLFIHISSIQFANVIYPVVLSVFDLDGVEGIHVPGSVSRDVVKSAAEQSLQSVNVLSLDPSIKTQAVTAGISAAKNLLSKKVKSIRVTIAAGYRVLIRDNKTN